MMHPRRRRRLFITVLILLALSVALGLVMYALRTNIDLFYTPSEIRDGKGSMHLIPKPGQHLRIGGYVLPGSVKRDPNNLSVSFVLYDTRNQIRIFYKGILPDLFREGQGIVAEGRLTKDSAILAQVVLAKHDEKYTPPDIEHVETVSPVEGHAEVVLKDQHQ